MKRINCMVSDEAKKVLKTFKENSTHSTLDEALSDMLENYKIEEN